jgi:hypothetical protein
MMFPPIRYYANYLISYITMKIENIFFIICSFYNLELSTRDELKANFLFYTKQPVPGTCNCEFFELAIKS